MDAEIRKMEDRQVLAKPNQMPVNLEAVAKSKKSSTPTPVQEEVERKKSSTTMEVVKKPLKTPFKDKEINADSGDPVVQEGEDEDEEIRRRRDKVKAVRKT
jgi:hypothetical protein